MDDFERKMSKELAEASAKAERGVAAQEEMATVIRQQVEVLENAQRELHGLAGMARDLGQLAQSAHVCERFHVQGRAMATAESVLDEFDRVWRDYKKRAEMREYVKRAMKTVVTDDSAGTNEA